MKHTNICIVRPTYYDRSAMLQLSLEYQQEAESSDKFETYIFVDPHSEYGYVDDYDSVITDKYIRINWPRNSGKYNWYDANKYIFNNTKYDYVISIEDDIIISNDYIRLCEQLAIHDDALSKDDNILFFHSGGLADCRSLDKNPNKIVSSRAASRSTLICRKKFKIIDDYVKKYDINSDNDNLLKMVLNNHNMITLSPDFGRDGHFGIYGWSSNGIHGNIQGKTTIFSDNTTHQTIYNTLKANCLSKDKLLQLNNYKTPEYFWNFNPDISFDKLVYEV